MKPIQPWVQPYLTAYGGLARRTPETAEEAERVSEEMRRILGKLFSLVEPYPSEEDVWPVFLGLMNIIQSRGVESTSLFRPRVSPGGGSAGEGGSSAAVGSSGDGSGRVLGS